MTFYNAMNQGPWKKRKKEIALGKAVAIRTDR